MKNPDPGDLKRAARLFKALSHPDRLRVACRLTDGDELTQRELLEETGWPQSTMARHVGELRRAGLLRGERHGSEVALEALPVVAELMAAVCEWRHPETGDAFVRRYGNGNGAVETTA